MTSDTATGMARKTPTLGEIHTRVYELDSIVEEINLSIVGINDFLLSPSPTTACEADKNPESPCGKLQEIDNSIGRVKSRLESLLQNEKRIMQTLGCTE